LRLHQRVDEAPADGGVVNLGSALECFGRLTHYQGRPRHRLDAAGDGEIDFTGADRARRFADRVEAGGAQPVHGDPRNRIRESRQRVRATLRLSSPARLAQPNTPSRRDRPSSDCAPSTLIGAAAIVGAHRAGAAIARSAFAPHRR
jgi:hypothetical protein